MGARKIFFPELREPKILDLSRMARKLRVTQAWLRSVAESGLVPCLNAGGRLLFVPKAVETALAALAAKPNPPQRRRKRNWKHFKSPDP